MPLVPGLQLPFGIQPVNPVLVDSYAGPYSSIVEALSSIPSALRVQTRFVHIIDGGVGKLYWFRDGIADGNLVEFSTAAIASLNGLTASSQTFATGSTGTDFGISSVGSVHTFNIPTASSLNRGLLSSADWSTFNGKEPAIAAGTTTQYWRGDKSWQTLDTAAVAENPGFLYFTENRVLNTPLTGLNVTGGTVLATDSLLAAFGKLQNQINGLMGGVVFVDFWNASTNTPTIPTAVGNKGKYYIVNVPGNTNIDGITEWQVGDWVISNGTVWGKVDNTDSVVSVNGYTGAINLVTGDISEGAGTIPGRPSQLFFTDARARAALSFVAGSGAYNSTTGVITIPTNTNQLTNGAGYITSVTGTLNRIAVTGGTTIDIASTYIGQSSITTLGTITTGVWNGSAIGDSFISSSTNWNTAFDTRIQFGILSARPAAGTNGRNYYATDNGIEYFDNGSAWVIKGGALTGDVNSSPNSLSTTVVGLRGAALPTLSVGNLRYNGSAWVFDSTGYLPLSGGTVTGAVTVRNTLNIMSSDGIMGVRISAPINFGSQMNIDIDQPSQRILIGNGNLNQSVGIQRDSALGGLIIRSAFGQGFAFYDGASQIATLSGGGNFTANSFIKSGGTSTQFLKADGSVDSNTYATTSSLGAYLPLSGGTLTGITTMQNTYLGFNTASAQRGIVSTYNYIIGGSSTDYSFGLFSEGEIFFAAGGSATKRLTIATTGAATFSSSVTAQGNSRFIASGGIGTPLLHLMQSNNVDGYYLSVDNAVDGRMELRSQAGAVIQTWYRSNLNTVFPNGNVGIGIASPGNTLHVNGTAAFGVTSTAHTVGITAANSADADILIVGMSGVTNGFRVQRVSSVMRYTMLDGNLGIGTGTPSYRLHASNLSNGTTAAFGGSSFGLRIDNGGSFGNGGSTIHGVDNTFVGSYQKLSINGSSLEFMTDYSTRLTIANSGVVTFTNTLLLGSNSTIYKPNVSSGTFASPLFENIMSYGTSTFLSYIQGGNSFNSTTGTWLRFVVNNHGGTLPINALTIVPNGNVGILNTTPYSALDVSYENSFNSTTPGTSPYGIYLSGQATNGFATGITFSAGGASAGSAQAGIYSQGSGSYGTRMYFATTNNYGVGSITRMMINENGNVGIGTSPAFNLHVRVDQGSGTLITSQNNATGNSFNYAGFNAIARTTGGAEIGFGIAAWGGGSVRQNEVWLGSYTNHPLVLNVNDSERLRIATSGAITAQSSITATAFFESSDLRQKSVFSTLNSADGIAAINYIFLPDGSTKWGYGAQHVQNILPYAVYEGSDNLLKVDYTTVHTYKIAMLEQRIEELEKELDNYRNA